MERRPPRLGRVLLRFIPLGARRAEIEADLVELLAARRRLYGRGRAAWRYLGDVLSLLAAGTLPSAQPSRGARSPSSSPFEGLGRDAMYAVRMFARQPVTIAITIVGLGLAIGVSGSIFTLMNATFLRGDGVRDSARAPRVMRTVANDVSTAWGYNEYLQLQAAATRSRVEAWIDESAWYSLSAAMPEDPPSIPVAFVSGGYMEALYAKAAVGRILIPADSSAAAPPVVVVSHAFWKHRMGEDPAVIGRTLRVGYTRATIVGVSERPFMAPFTNGAGVWMPISTNHLVYDGKPFGAGTTRPVSLVARVKPDVPLVAAEAELTAIAASLGVSGDPERRVGARFDEDGRLGRPPASQRLTIAVAVSVVIALVLVLACVNVASVLLANATTRHREIGVRLALGATRGRIIRQLLTESVLLAGAASGVGLFLTIWLGPVLTRLIRAPSLLDMGFDVNVYLFFVAVAFACGLGAGLVPSRIGVRGDVIAPLKGAGVAAPSAAPRRLRSALLATQAAAAILLLVIATLFLRATFRASRIDIGFDADRLIALSVGLGRYADHSRMRTYLNNVLDAVTRMPGVESAALAQYPPFGGVSQLRVEERDGQRVLTYFNGTSANYFDTVGLRLVRGRTYTAEEAAREARVAVVSETFARRFWKDGDAVGADLKPVHGEEGVVIGVVSDAIVARLHEGMPGIVYRPLSSRTLATARLVVRTAGNPATIARSLREAVRTVDPSSRVTSKVLSEGLEEEVSRPRMIAFICGAMASLAVVLAALGLYGITAAVVGQRRREIGLRMALGAERRDIERLLMRDSLTPVFVGLGAGVCLALLGGRAISGALFGIPPYDPFAFGGAVVILLASAFGAALIPTRSAARVDPAFVLRQG